MVVGGGAGTVVVEGSSLSPALADVVGAGGPRPAALVASVSDGARCPDESQANGPTTVAGGAADTRITDPRDVSLSDPSRAIGGQTFGRPDDSAYALRIPVESTEQAPGDCPGVARYEAAMGIPAGEDPWMVHVSHDGRYVTTLLGDAESTGVNGSASAGERVDG